MGQFKSLIITSSVSIFLLILAACAQNSPSNKYVPGSEERCWEQTADAYGPVSATTETGLAQAIAEYRELVNRSYICRKEAIRLLSSLKYSISSNEPLRGYDLDQLNQGMLFLLDLRNQLYHLAYFHNCWLNAPDETFAAAGLDHLTKEEQLTGIMLSLSASLLLYDNYLLLVTAFVEDPKLRYFLNQRDSGYDIGSRELDRATASYNSLALRQKVQEAMAFYERGVAVIPPDLLHDEDFLYLQGLIEQSPSYQLTRHPSLIAAVGREIRFMEAITHDSLQSLADEGVSLFSVLFGNTVGLIQTRKGKLFNRLEIEKSIFARLQAGDILLEKTPFRLTDSFIPGHWGHAAIWIGTEEELKKIGIWDHPVVIPYQEMIRKGHGIVEALRSGVQLNTLQQFLDIDDFASIRNPDLSNSQKGDRIILALRQVGKAYDFNFNVETTDKIVCSELIYTVYVDMEWPTEKTLGRYTISPDHVAMMALGQSPLQIVQFYHDGEQVTGNSRQLMARLIRHVE